MFAENEVSYFMLVALFRTLLGINDNSVEDAPIVKQTDTTIGNFVTQLDFLNEFEKISSILSTSIT